ncbi:hypothetical protein CR513_51349, partial [Mucuna pruriens]
MEIRARAKKHVEAKEAKENRLHAEKEISIVGKKDHSWIPGPPLEVYHLHLLDIPPPTEWQLCPSQEEWCEFHQTRGHLINKCRVLKVR